MLKLPAATQHDRVKLGATHQCLEDIGICVQIPGMVVGYPNHYEMMAAQRLQLSTTVLFIYRLGRLAVEQFEYTDPDTYTFDSARVLLSMTGRRYSV